MFSTTVGFFSVCFATLLCTILVEANEPATCNGFFTVLAELGKHEYKLCIKHIQLTH